MEIDTIHDRALILSSQKGDKQAFGLIVKRYMQRAYFVALGFVGVHEDAMDLSQEAFVRSFKAIKRFDPEKKFFTWFYQILRNCCYNFLRDQKKNVYAFSEISGRQLLELRDEESNHPDSLFEKRELAECIWRTIQELPENEKEIILLREFQEMSYREIADLLEIPMGTVMSRLYTARKKMAHQFKNKL
ncbi:sigma-70 family RNA polymerase sigma factor [bacterium]|nr:sigma-70 family RNA polymerase sigma factor [bacterium]